jgi:hypothetical protein
MAHVTKVPVMAEMSVVEVAVTVPEPVVPPAVGIVVDGPDIRVIAIAVAVAIAVATPVAAVVPVMVMANVMVTVMAMVAVMPVSAGGPEPCWPGSRRARVP